MHDTTGKCVNCVAYGRQAYSNALVVGNELVIFFAQALHAKGKNNESALCLFDTAHIVKITHDSQIPPLKYIISFQ